MTRSTSTNTTSQRSNNNNARVIPVFTKQLTLVDAVSNFAGLVAKTLEPLNSYMNGGDNDTYEQAAVLVYRRLEPDLIPEEYMGLKDAWSAIRLNPTNNDVVEEFNAVVTRIMYRATTGHYANITG